MIIKAIDLGEFGPFNTRATHINVAGSCVSTDSLVSASIADERATRRDTHSISRLIALSVEFPVFALINLYIIKPVSRRLVTSPEPS